MLSTDPGMIDPQLLKSLFSIEQEEEECTDSSEEEEEDEDEEDEDSDGEEEEETEPEDELDNKGTPSQMLFGTGKIRVNKDAEEDSAEEDEEFCSHFDLLNPDKVPSFAER